MNRRRFLKRAGLAGLGTFLQACNLTDLTQIARLGRTSVAEPALLEPTPTPTSSPTFTTTPTAIQPPLTTSSPLLPTSTNTAEATPTENIADTATPPTATPTTTPTPTPSPTPYPPGPPSKLGLFVTRFHPTVLEMTAMGQPALIKTLEIDANFAKGLKDSSPTSLIIGRIVLGQMNLEAEPSSLIQAYVEQLLPLATDPTRMAAFAGWEAYNEPLVDTPDKMMRLADFEAERIRILAENGIISVAGNFAVGHPQLEFWPLFEPALAALQQYGGYLGLHEYSAPVMQYRAGALQEAGDPPQGDEGWLTLRYRKAYRQFLEPMGYGDIPILITECGVDGLVWPRPGPREAKGWQDFSDTWRANGLRDDPPGVYMDQLIWYDQNIQQDAYVKGAAIFLAGSNDEQWETYDILGPDAGRMADLLTQYLSVHPPDGLVR